MADNFTAKVGIELEADKATSTRIAKEIMNSFKLVEQQASKLSFLDETAIKKQMQNITKMINGNLKGIDFSKYTNQLLETLSKGTAGATEFRKQLNEINSIMTQISGKNFSKELRESMRELTPAQMDTVLKMYQKQQKAEEEYIKIKQNNQEKAYNLKAKELNSLIRTKDITSNPKYQKAISTESISLTKKGLGIDSTKKGAEQEIKEYNRLLGIYEVLIEKRNALLNSSAPKDIEDLIITNKTLLNLYDQINNKEKKLTNAFKAKTTLSSELSDFNEGILRKNIGTSMSQYVSVTSQQALQQIQNINKNIAEEVIRLSTKNLEKRTEDQLKRNKQVKEKFFQSDSFKEDNKGNELTSNLQQTETAIEKTSKAASDLKQEINSINNSDTDTGLFAQSLENIKDQFKDVAKYAVDYETALTKIKQINKTLNTRPLSEEEIQDLSGYGQRILSLNKDLPSSIEDDFYDYALNDLSIQVDKMTRAQLAEIDKIKQSSTLDIDKILNTDKLSNENVSALKNMTSVYSERLNELNTLVNYNKNLQQTNAFLKDGNDLIEERAILMKKGSQVGEEYISSSEKGQVDIKNGIQKYDADAVLHTHPYDSEINNLRFSDRDIKNLVDGSIKKAYLMCGNEIATMDFSKIGSSSFKELQSNMLNTYSAVFARYGATIQDDKVSDIQSLKPEVQNQAADVINNLLASILHQYGGGIYFDKIEGEDLINNDANRILPISSSELDILNEFRKAASSQNAAEELIKLQEKYQVSLEKTKQKAQETQDIISKPIGSKNDNSSIQEQQKLQQELQDTQQQLKKTEEIKNKLEANSIELSNKDTESLLSSSGLTKNDQYINQENISLNKLKDTINSVTAAVDEKTAAFLNEQSTVENVVSSEIDKLNQLQSNIETSQDQLKVNKELDSLKNTSEKDIKKQEESKSDSTSTRFKKADKITQSLNRLIKKEQTYQRIMAKQETGQPISGIEAALLKQREQDLELIAQATKLTETQKKKQSEYNQEVQRTIQLREAYVKAESIKTSQQKAEESRNKNEKIKEKISLAENKISKALSGSNITQLQNYSQVVDRVNNKIQELNNAFQKGDISASDYNSSIKKIVSGLIHAEDQAKDTTEALEKMKRAAIERGASESDIRISNDGKTVTAKIKDEANNIYTLTQRYNDASETISRNMVKSGKAVGGFSKILSGWKGKLGEVVRYLASFGSVYEIFNVLRQGVGVIRDLDDALTEMNKVSDEPLSVLKAYQKESFAIADAVGSTGQQIQQSTADWQRLGESLSQAKESAKASNILLNVSEFDSIDSATESLVSMSQAYSELDKMDIIDKLNNIGNNFSISTDGIATALQKSASALKTANNSIDESIALITAGNAVVQNPDSVGAGIRTIALRIQGTEEAKAELEEMGEEVDDYVVQTASKIDATVRNFTAVASNNFKGVSVLDSNGNYRSTYQILQDIADIYEEIVATDKQMGTNHLAGLLETLAGKNRSNIAASIIQNGDMLRSVYQDSQNSEGSALEENQKYLDSISGHLDQLKNKWQEVWSSTAGRDSVNMVLDLAKGLLDIVDTIGLLPTAGIFGAIFGTFYNYEKTFPFISKTLD